MNELEKLGYRRGLVHRNVYVRCLGEEIDLTGDMPRKFVGGHEVQLEDDEILAIAKMKQGD